MSTNAKIQFSNPKSQVKIICIGRNYACHAKEMNSPLPDEPVFFLKPETALITGNKPFTYPAFSNEIHYEVELVLKINRPGKSIEEKNAHQYYDEIGIGIDFTARDIQRESKQQGLPWEKAKAFDGSAPVGRFLNKIRFQDINNIAFCLNLNGKTVQAGNSKDLLFSFNAIISHVSQFITLIAGDFIFTGTPEGVGAVNRGDQLSCYIGKEKLLDFRVE